MPVNDILNKLRLVKNLEWNDVFSLWRDAEANLPHWVEHYRAGGYNSWDEWRKHTLRELPCQNLEWKLFEVENPIETIPQFFGGPFRAWTKKYYNGKRNITFADIILNRDLAESKTVQEMLKNFPTETFLIGIQNNNKIVIIEGMHRSCALALASKEKKSLKTKVFIAIANYSHTLPEMGQLESPT